MKRNEIMQGKKELKEMLKDYKANVEGGKWNYNDRVNSFLIRFHRLVLDGSYTGEQYYQLMQSRLNKNLNISGYRLVVLNTFARLAYHEFFNSEYYISSNEIWHLIKEVFGDDTTLLNDLLDNVKDFQVYQLGCKPTECRF